MANTPESGARAPSAAAASAAPAGDELRYPVGKFELPAAITREQRRQCIAEIADLPQRLRAAVAGLSDPQLDTPYRPGGWTIRQLVHHIADSHMHSYIRFKLAMTEERPTIKPYDEGRWAKLPEAKNAPVEVSLDLIDALHRRWVMMLEHMSDADFEHTFLHPELGEVALGPVLALYAWHSRHHLAHIRNALARAAAAERP
jgi:uncharacterized damage-inducible protein DinB